MVMSCQAYGAHNLLSASRDGSAVCTTVSSQNNTSPYYQYSMLKEPASLCSIDYDTESNLTAVASSIGGLWVSGVAAGEDKQVSSRK